jgi:hypothetical protein
MAAKKSTGPKTAGKKPSRATKPTVAAKAASQAAEEQIATVAVAIPAQDEVPPAPAKPAPAKPALAKPVLTKPVLAKPASSQPAPTKPAPAKPLPTNGSRPASYPDLAALGRENLAALARANAVLVKGFEEIGQEVASCAEQSLLSAMDTARALVGIRTLADLVALNSKVAQATLEGALANTARLSEIGIRVATEALGPFNERVVLAFGRAGQPAK